MPRSLPSTGAITGLGEALAFFRDPAFAQERFATHGDVFETSLLGQRLIFIRGDAAIGDLFRQGDAVEGWWPESVRRLLGSRSLANRNGEAHKARRRVVGQQVGGCAKSNPTATTSDCHPMGQGAEEGNAKWNIGNIQNVPSAPWDHMGSY